MTSLRTHLEEASSQAPDLLLHPSLATQTWVAGQARRRRKQRAAVAATVLAVVSVVAGALALNVVGPPVAPTLGTDRLPPVLVRGAPADPATFSLTTLWTPMDRASAEAARLRIARRCESGDTVTHAGPLAGSAADPTAIPKTVEIAGEQVVPQHVLWGPRSCTYRSYAELGVDPYVFLATRQAMTELLAQADQAAQPDLTGVTSRWGDCLGVTDANPTDLLNSLDGSSRSPYGHAGSECLTPQLAAQAVAIRARHHLVVAAQHQPLIDAWTTMADDQTRAARGTP